MIFGGEFITGVDLIDVSLWTFTLFFFALVMYLQMEGKREGYPAEEDTTGKPDPGIFFFPPKKTFNLPNGRGSVTAPPGGGDDNRKLALKRTAAWPGAPYEPTGNPLADGVGPASWSPRADVPDLTDDGRPRIVPFRAGDGYDVANEDADPRGMTVYGGDGRAAGKVVDLWIDRSEAIIRYLEVEVGDEPTTRRVLLPTPFANVDGARKRVTVFALFAEHFKDVPGTASPMQVTRLEEDKITGYYGGGTLYASKERLEPFV
ncbi:MAG: photosynthetic reaction center subunit H [Pseudomonadota bacterium]